MSRKSADLDPIEHVVRAQGLGRGNHAKACYIWHVKLSQCVSSQCVSSVHTSCLIRLIPSWVSCLPGRCSSCNMLLVRSSLWNTEEWARAQPEDADGIDFPGEFWFVRCVCLRECTHGFRVLEFANVL